MEVKKILLTEILPDPMNPRKTFDEAELKELADNIKAQGLLQPITVRPIECCSKAGIPTLLNVDNKYAIVCGERRYRACKLLAEQEKDKRATILAIVRDLNDDEAFDAMITENLQRKDVDPVEEAFAFGQLMKKGGTAEDIALRFGKSVRFVQDRIKLNSLIPELLLMVKEGTMPISAGMIIAKLDEDNQHKFYERNGKYNNTSKAHVNSFLGELFSSLSNAAWRMSPSFKGGCGRECRECPMNTNNAGCLFWEMNSKDGGRCTDIAKFRDKQIAWMYHFIQKHGGDMVGKGDGLEYGKTVIINTGYTYSEETKAFHKRVIDDLEDNGFEIVKSDVFGSKCYYDDGDERVQKLHKEGEVYRCIDIFAGYSSLNPKVVYYYLKKQNSETNADGKPTGNVQPAEVIKLVGQHKRNVELANEKMFAEYRKLATDMEECKRRGELNEDEQFALDCLILKQCGEKMRERYGLTTYGTPAHKFMEVVKNNQADRQMWYREFLRMTFSSSEMGYGTSLAARLAYDVLVDWKPKEAKEIGQKAIAALDKKQQRIKEKLEELGYDINGKKIK